LWATPRPEAASFRRCEPIGRHIPAADGGRFIDSFADRRTVLAHQDRLNIAVFIDFDNIEIGVKSTLGEHFDVGPILDAIKERGEVVSKIAYADWTRAGEYSRALTQHAIRLVQRNLTPGGDKNGADINMALDALEMAFTHPHINAYVIVGGDSDFLSLVEKLKQYDKKVFVVGGRQFTSIILQRNCHEFVAYENLTRSKQVAKTGDRPQAPRASTPLQQAIPIVRRALKILADREVSPQTGLLKSTLLQLDSTFSERNYGASSFLDFVEKLSQAGLVTLKHAGRSVMVELNEGVTDEGGAEQPQQPQFQTQGQAQPQAHVQPHAQPQTHAQPQPHEQAQPQGQPQGSSQGQRSDVRPTESQEAGVARARQLLAGAANARWPMYLRNVKQILRQADGGFDERRYGFGGLMDLLKALQRDSLVRIERDRRGGLRVFQGTALQQAARSQVYVGLPKDVEEEEIETVEAVPVEAQPGEMITTEEPLETEQAAAEPIPIDTTAELLGRRTRKPRPRVARGGGAGVREPQARSEGRGARKTAAKKPAARKTTRAKKSSAADAQSDTE
jgi:uncharacterized LabA/DUF88 family protein